MSTRLGAFSLVALIYSVNVGHTRGAKGLSGSYWYLRRKLLEYVCVDLAVAPLVYLSNERNIARSAL